MSFPIKSWFSVLLLFIINSNFLVGQNKEKNYSIDSSNYCNTCALKFPLQGLHGTPLYSYKLSFYLKAASESQTLMDGYDTIKVNYKYDLKSNYGFIKLVSPTTIITGFFEPILMIDDWDTVRHYYFGIRPDSIWTTNYYGQTEVISTHWKNGIKSGEEKVIRNGSIIQSGNYYNGVQVGEWLERADGGAPCIVYYDIHGNAVYSKIFWSDTNRIVKTEVFLITDSLLMTIYSDSGYYQAWQNKRVIKTYYPNGKIESESVDYLPIHVVEQYTFWYENGAIKSTDVNKEGITERKIWYENGHLKSIEYYKYWDYSNHCVGECGIKTGKHQFWDENGVLIEKHQYKN